MADKLISSLTAATSIADADWIVIETAAGNSRKVSGADSKSSMSPPTIPEGRLTLVSATPVLTSDQTAKTAIYYALYLGDRIPIYDGANWDNTTFTELTLNLDTTNHASGSVYDVFVWNNSGTVSIGTGPAWTSSTGRGTGAGTTELQMKNGIWTNKVTITLKNGAGAGTTGVAANTATYVGTFYATANGQTGMAFQPAAAGGGTNNILGLYNAYNRIKATAICRDNTTSWTYATASWRASDNSSSNRISFVDGLAQSPIVAQFTQVNTTSTSANNVAIGTNLDSTTSTPKAVGAQGSTAVISVTAKEPYLPVLGFHYVSAVEYTTAATSTYYGFINNNQYHGLTVDLDM